ncbi:hypothetical protein [Caballeronia sp. M23-90]
MKEDSSGGALWETDAQFGNSRADHGARAAKTNTLFFQSTLFFYGLSKQKG